MGFTDKTAFSVRNGFSFGIFASLITFCSGVQCGTKLSLKASTEPTLYPSYRMYVKNMFQCDTACRRDPSCVSANYDHQNKHCDLNTFQQRTYNSHSQAKKYLRKNCQDEVKACEDCGRDRRCVRTAEDFKCIHGDVTIPLAVVDCGPPSVVPNGNVNYNTTTYSSQGQIVCNTGYNFSHISDIISCTANGTWDVLLGSCQAMGCGSPPDTPFGTYNYSSTTYGSLSHLLCNTGYRFNGSNSTVTCRADGTWDSILGSCDAVNCGSPGAIPNGVNNCSSNATTFGSLCHLTCNPGYSFIGASSTITCSDDGTWETYSASCVVDCGIPTVENAVVLYNATIHGSRVKVTCVNETFMYNGDAWAECNEHGTWTRLPLCRENVVTLGDWVLLFRVKAGNGISMYDVWRNATIYQDHPVVPEDLQPGCISLDTSLQCDIHFKSKLVTPTSWITSNIKQVKVLILKSNQVKAEVLFNGQGTTWESWFSKTNYISSTWTDLTSTARTDQFMIQGHEDTERRFYINSFFGGCGTDVGWMLIKDQTKTSYCDWERKFDLPAIFFSEGKNASLSGDFQSADVMAVLAKLE